VLQTAQAQAKRLLNKFFARLGLRIIRLRQSDPQGGAKYFNTGNRSPLEENSCELYDRFYRDHEALQRYYNNQRIGFYVSVSRCLQDHDLKLDDKDVLDAGCGTGHLLAELHKWSEPRSMAGCDFSEEAMKYSREHFPGVRFFTHDIYRALPGIYDVVLCTEVLEHLLFPFVAINNLIQAVPPGGHVVVTVPNGRLDQLNEHINFWSPESWKVFVERECPGSKVATSLLQAGRYNFALIQRSPAE